MPGCPKHQAPQTFASETKKSDIRTRTYSSDLIERTIEVWQPRCDVEITDARAIEILDNTVGFLDVLGEWVKAEKED